MASKPSVNMNDFIQRLSAKTNEIADALLEPDLEPGMPLMTATLKKRLAAMSEEEREKTMEEFRKNAPAVLASQRTEFDQDL